MTWVQDPVTSKVCYLLSLVVRLPIQRSVGRNNKQYQNTNKLLIYYQSQNWSPKLSQKSSADHSPAECSHTGLFIEKPLGDVPQSCNGE